MTAVVKNFTSQLTLMLITTHCKYKQANKIDSFEKLKTLHINVLE